MHIPVKGDGSRGVPENLAEGLDFKSRLHTAGGEGMPKLVEAENRALLVVAESRICYNADRLWLCRSLFCMERRGLRMARKAVSIRL